MSENTARKPMNSPCKRGHLGERYISSGQCVECNLELARSRDKDSVRAYQREWARADRRSNPEKHRAGARRRYSVNREKVLDSVKAYAARNVEKISERKKKKYASKEYKARRTDSLRRLYGITHDDYERMYRDQDGCCAICSEQHPVLDVDHCHRNGDVRGLLCQKCNKALGLLKDDVGLLQAAADYLRVLKK
jgi:hypothetical protein